MDGSPSETDAGSRPNVNITNITAPIQGPVFMGNESVSFGGAGNGGNGGVFSTTPFNHNVPILKPSATEITPDGGVITVGGASLEYTRYTVQEAKQAMLSYKVDVSEPPKLFIRASSSLVCGPKFRGLQHVNVCLPTFCSTRKSVAATVYMKDDEGRWQFIDEDVFKRRRQISVSAGEISNMTAFIPKERMVDVEYAVACFLFNNADGQFVTGFCLDDAAIKAAFCYRITSNGFSKTVHIPDVLQTRLGDEIAFKISPGQSMVNTKMTIDENFVSRPEGFMTRCTLKKNAVDPQYYITHSRDGKEIDDFVYGVETEGDREGGMCGIYFQGNAEIRNVIDSVKNVEIDQSTNQDEDGVARENGRDGTPKKIGGILFRGEAKIGNLVRNAHDVKLNQSNRSWRSKQGSIERIVPAQQPEHEEETTAAVKVTGDVKDQAVPISLDCEGKAGDDGTVEGQGSVEDEAQPIWKDCEKQDENEEDRSGAETDTSEKTSSKRHEEQAAGQNKAGPIYNDESSGNSDSNTQNGGSSNSVPEVDLKRGPARRRKKPPSGKLKTAYKPKIEALVVPDNESSKKSPSERPSQSFDTWHYVMIAIIGILLYIIVTLQSGGSP